MDQRSTHLIQSRAQGHQNPKALTISGGLERPLSDLFCSLPVQPPDPMGEQPQAAFHLSPKADAAFSNSYALFFSSPVFIYLLLVLKTKIVFLFNALEMGGWMRGGAVCMQSQNHLAPGGACEACVHVVYGKHVNPLNVLCTSECVCACVRTWCVVCVTCKYVPTCSCPHPPRK